MPVTRRTVTTATKAVKKQPAPQLAGAGRSFADRAREFLTLRKEAASIEDRMGKLKKDLKAEVETSGVEDEKGHFWKTLPEPILGYTALKAERRESKSLNTDVAAKVLKQKRLTEQCTTTLLHVKSPEKLLAYLKKNAPELLGEVVDTSLEFDIDAILAAHYDGKLSEADIDAIITTKVNYYFVPAKERGVA